MPAEMLEQENRRLRREIAMLRQEQAFANKAAVYSRRSRVSGTPRCSSSRRARGTFQVRLMRRMFKVAVSGFYAFLKRPLSWRALIDEPVRSAERAS